MATAIGEWLRIVLGPVILIFLGSILFKLVSELIRLSRDEDFPAFESNWGGLGRGLGGWSVNRMMVIGVLALLTLLLFGSFSYLMMANGPAPSPDAGKTSERASQTVKPPETVTPSPAPAKASDATSGGDQPTAPQGKE